MEEQDIDRLCEDLASERRSNGVAQILMELVACLVAAR
jgi:hypothetical protein